VAASPADLEWTADAQELGRQGSGSVAARMTAVPARELTLSTQVEILRASWRTAKQPSESSWELTGWQSV
jgi:hypothetical protein